MISIVNTECHVPKTFSDLAKIAAWGRLGLYGAMLDLAARAQGDGNALALWKRRGKRAFDAEAEGQDNAEGNAHD
jgi:hypothetical protein